jgi:hypothetical protein
VKGRTYLLGLTVFAVAGCNPPQDVRGRYVPVVIPLVDPTKGGEVRDTIVSFDTQTGTHHRSFLKSQPTNPTPFPYP